MNKTLKVIGIILAILIFVCLAVSLSSFAVTGDIKDGIWALLFAIALRAEVSFDGGNR